MCVARWILLISTMMTYIVEDDVMVIVMVMMAIEMVMAMAVMVMTVVMVTGNETYTNQLGTTFKQHLNQFKIIKCYCSGHG